MNIITIYALQITYKNRSYFIKFLASTSFLSEFPFP